MLAWSLYCSAMQDRAGTLFPTAGTAMPQTWILSFFFRWLGKTTRLFASLKLRTRTRFRTAFRHHRRPRDVLERQSLVIAHPKWKMGRRLNGVACESEKGYTGSARTYGASPGFRFRWGLFFCRLCSCNRPPWGVMTIITAVINLNTVPSQLLKSSRHPPVLALQNFPLDRRADPRRTRKSRPSPHHSP